MNACIRSLLVVLASTLCTWPLPAGAQTQADPSSGPFITAEQAHDAFTAAGYAADPIIDWAWRTPSQHTLLRTFEVRDSANQRLVMVLVFPSFEAVGFVRNTVAVHRQAEEPDQPLVAGYGPSVWRGNVAMVESTQSTLARVAELEADQDTSFFEDPSADADARAPDIQVDLDFQQALNNSDVNL
jgi:hypothetical protein